MKAADMELRKLILDLIDTNRDRSRRQCENSLQIDEKMIKKTHLQ